MYYPSITRGRLGYNGHIFGCTGMVGEDDIKVFISKGANKVIGKPLSAAVFKGAIKGNFSSSFKHYTSYTLLMMCNFIM